MALSARLEGCAGSASLPLLPEPLCGTVAFTFVSSFLSSDRLPSNLNLVVSSGSELLFKLR